MMHLKILISIQVLVFLLPIPLQSQIVLPPIFSDYMVLQRDEPITIWGTCIPSEKIVVTIESEGSGSAITEEVFGNADHMGNWRIELESQAAGGPYKIKIATKQDTVLLEDVYFGEVWLCSGQSNMEWPLKNSQYGTEALQKAPHPNIRLFHLKKIHNMYSAPFTTEEAEAVAKGDFFEQGKWVIANPSESQEFSAVGYYFAELLADSLEGIPIGVIQNAVSGSPAQSWHQASPEEIAHWPKNETYHPWLKERAQQNWNGELDVAIHRHPFEPGYLYNSAVVPLAPYPVKGVLWYQGESNATHPDSYPSMMTKVIEDWRALWDKALPFLFVQLPKIGNRSLWPEFRAQQEEVLDITGTGMITLIDEGHPTDVHPTHKRVVGHRLAYLALNKFYGFDAAPISPRLDQYLWNIDQRSIMLTFKDLNVSFETMKATNIKGFVIRGYEDGGRRETTILPVTNMTESTIMLEYPANFLPVHIQYNWSPFPEGNIKTVKGMPLMPFGIQLPGNN